MAPNLIEVLEVHHRDSWGWALACCQWQQSLADDVLQESYLRVLDGRARFGGKSTEKTWFFGIIKRVALELGRSQARQGWHIFTTVAAVPEPAEQDPGLAAAEHDESSGQLRSALNAIPQRQREVLHLVFYAELTLEQAAHTLGMSLGSARTHYHRGKSRLAELLELSHE
jgi:RNA polymerase sigma-70 factor (ECF subfamily)